MYYEKKTIIIAFLLTTTAGVVLHFIYHWFPSNLTALIAPVSESLWEHGKLIFYPGLAAGLVLAWGRPGGLAPWLFSTVLSTVAMLSVAYLVHIVLDVHSLPFDIGLYYVAMLLLFWLAPRLGGWFQGAWGLIPFLAVGVLWSMVILFSFSPPQGDLFQNHAASAYHMCGHIW